MITLKLTQKQTELIIHSLGSEAIRLNDDSFISVRDKVSQQLSQCYKRSSKKSVNLVLHQKYVINNGKTIAKYYGERNGQHAFMTDSFYEFLLTDINGVKIYPAPSFIVEGKRFSGTMEEALQGVSGFENDPSGFKPDLLTWCKDNLTEIK